MGAGLVAVTITVSQEGLLSTCGSKRWVSLMAERAPFESVEELHAAADSAFDQLEERDWIEAFEHHPRIGDVESLRERFAASGAFSEREQEGLSRADEAVLEAIQRNNDAYEQQHGFVFLVRAAGRSASDILRLQRERLANDRPTELRVAAGEQREITHLRLEARLEPVD